jgi:sialate O-acetylesterase
MRLTGLLTLAAAIGPWLPAARADVQPHPLFADHMVFQQGRLAPVWGTADPGETVRVTLSLTKPNESGAVSEVATADSQGRWKVRLAPGKAGTGYTLTITGKASKRELKDVAVGEVWVCSGQSNMQWEFWRLTKDDQGKKVSAAAANPNIRLFTVPRRSSSRPEADFPVSTFNRTKEHKVTFGTWQECTPETVYEFSAVAYYFGRDLQKVLGVPVGLIACNWGGTPAEAWTSKEALAAVPELAHYLDAADPAKIEAKYKADYEKWKAAAEEAKVGGKQAPRAPLKPGPGGVTQHTPTALFNGLVHPILQYSIKGVIWYQGESNAGKAAEYYTLYPTMIADWRTRWGYDFPFLAAQLAPYRGTQGSAGADYAEVRDALFQATRKLPKVGVAVITDVGDETDIHPQRKEPVGARLALAARAIAYGEKIEHSGPVYKSLTVTGDKAVLTFDPVGGGLVCKGDELHGFATCGDDKKFYPAKAKLEGDTVVVTCEKVEKPVAVRFGWVNFAKPELNFFNKAGLPAVPFRTDDFPLTTAKK